MSCPEGQYFCNDRQKCMPIPKGKKVRKDGELVKEGKKKGLWDNIHAKRKRGERPARPGEKDYPKTLNVEGAAWTKKEGKNKSGGLNEKGRKSYEAENPGSDLKSPSKKPGNKRRASFCARMKGMKSKLTSAKTARDPDSRINKSLRAWNCEYEPEGNTISEVAPPGWGHTKAEKEKTKPDKPKSKIGGTAAAFKRSLDRGDFKGLPGDKTKKEKTASMFKLMWSMKKKGDKPHYKPGTDKKYKKYQEEVVYEGRVARAVRDTIDKLPKGRLGGKRERIRQAAVNAEIRDKKSAEKGTTYKQWSDAVNSARERTDKKRKMNEQDSGMLGPIPGIAKAISTGASVLRTLSLGGDTPQSKKLSPKPKPKVKLNKP